MCIVHATILREEFLHIENWHDLRTLLEYVQRSDSAWFSPLSDSNTQALLSFEQQQQQASVLLFF